MAFFPKNENFGALLFLGRTSYLGPGVPVSKARLTLLLNPKVVAVLFAPSVKSVEV